MQSIPINCYTINRYKNDDFPKKTRIGGLSKKIINRYRFFGTVYRLFILDICPKLCALSQSEI